MSPGSMTIWHTSGLQVLATLPASLTTCKSTYFSFKKFPKHNMVTAKIVLNTSLSCMGRHFFRFGIIRRKVPWRVIHRHWRKNSPFLGVIFMGFSLNKLDQAIFSMNTKKIKYYRKNLRLYFPPKQASSSVTKHSIHRKYIAVCVLICW